MENTNKMLGFEFDMNEEIGLGKDQIQQFEQFSNYVELDILKDNYCPDCDAPMVIVDSDYQCETCGLKMVEFAGGIDGATDIINSNIRISTGANKGRFYNVVSDYSKTQKKVIEDQLYQHSTRYKGVPIPINVLKASATHYNHIQKQIVKIETDDDGKVTNSKKFVKRGSIKDEVLAAIIYFTCIGANVYRKKKDIAAFMELYVNGFARGEGIIRDLVAMGELELPVDDDSADQIADRYLEALGLEAENYSAFVIELVDLSDDRKIGMTSQLSSKVVAAIYIIICQCKLKITALTVEKQCDDTKKNTFMRFTKEVAKFKTVFEPIFLKHKIPTTSFFAS